MKDGLEKAAWPCPKKMAGASARASHGTLALAGDAVGGQGRADDHCCWLDGRGGVVPALVTARARRGHLEDPGTGTGAALAAAGTRMISWGQSLLVSDYLGDLDAFLGQVAKAPVTLVGHSLGATWPAPMRLAATARVRPGQHRGIRPARQRAGARARPSGAVAGQPAGR